MPDAAGDDERLRRAVAGLRLVHVLTVAESLRFLRGQLSFMRQLGIDITVVCGPGPQLVTIAESEGARVHVLAMTRAINPASDLRHLSSLARTLRQARADVVHGHTPKGGLLAMLAGTSAGIRGRIYHMRGLPFRTARGARRRLLIASERVSCALAQRVLCNSPSLRDVALEAHLGSPAKLRVIGGGSGNGIDTEHYDLAKWQTSRGPTRKRLGIPHDAVVVGFVGRFARDKGFAELASAWADVRNTSPGAHLLLVGENDERDPVSPSVLDALRADPTVHWSSWVPDPVALYPAMDVVALPSYREGFPNVPLEAASMEMPVVTTDAEGCRDSVADGTTGRIVPARDSAALAAALSEYVRDGDLRRLHGRAGRARCSRSFAREAIWRGIARTYEELAGTTSAAGPGGAG